MIHLQSISPYNDIYEVSVDPVEEQQKIEAFLSKGKGRKTVAVQGLGFVGSAMVAAIASRKDSVGKPLYNVIGVDLADEQNYWKIASINKGKSPVVSSDKSMDAAYEDSYRNRNVLATFSEYVYSRAEVVIIDIHLDIQKREMGNPYNYNFSYDKFLDSVRVVAENVKESALVIVETTVPPGTTERVIYTLFREIFSKRGLNIDNLCLSHSYERVMPGVNYLNSIINFFRVYSGINTASKQKAKEFFESFINTNDFPLCEMHSTTASEMAKVLENSFRAMNIAFIQEWTEYAETAGVNLFEIINAIRVRPTHKNIMLPGFGVGGYCLTKDSLFADWSYMNFFGAEKHLDMSLNALKTNDLMPEYAYSLLKKELHTLGGKHVTLLGISYLDNIADTRFTPAGHFYDICSNDGALLNLHDPLVGFWSEKNLSVNTEMEQLKKLRHDAAIFAVRHEAYLGLSSDEILYFLTGVKLIIDANNIINDETAKALSMRGVTMVGLGKGHWRKLRNIDE